MNVKNFTVWLITGLLLLSLNSLSAQVGINEDGAAPAASAMLDVVSTNKGVLVPRLTEAQKNAIVLPATGLLIFQSDEVAGFYFYTGTEWQFLGAEGPVGATGAAGADGKDGAQGPAGADGKDGAQGPAGVDGSDGAQGPAGAAGTNGSDGAQGPAGAQGEKGETGPAGADGGDDQTLSEVLAQGNIAEDSIDMNTTKRIINLAEPTMPQDAATKAYVDSKISTSSTRKVGDIFDGGIVFWVDNTGTSGLMASLDDLDGGSGIQWWPNTSTDISDVESMTDGKTNTDNIIAKANTDGIDLSTIAAGVAQTHTGGGKDDWYLPSNRELYLLCSQDILIDKILDNDANSATNGLDQGIGSDSNSGRYWSSTESNSSFAWYYRFPNGYSIGSTKPNTYRVRAVRAFGPPPPPPPAVGDFYEGGVIFHIFEDGETGYVEGETHGLIAAPMDQTDDNGIAWGCTGTDTPAPNVTSGRPSGNGAEIGYGATNTAAIVDVTNGGCNEAGAAKLCEDLELNGFSDWFLPSILEFEKMVAEKDNINMAGGSTFNEANSDPTYGRYWSSSEFASTNAWNYRFPFGLSVTANKSYNYRVRAIRAF